MTRAPGLGLAMLALATLGIPNQAAAQNLRFGSEFQVNQYTEGPQYLPRVASDAEGDFLITWNSFGQDSNATGVFARRFSSAGVGSSEFQVNVMTGGQQTYPSVAASATGAFVVAWQGLDGPSIGVFARRVANDGTPIGDEFRVNTYTPSTQRRAAVAAAAGGVFIVVWQGEDEDGGDDDVFGRRFSSSGVALAAEFLVNTYTTGVENYPAVASDQDGDFVVSWQRPDGSNLGIFARRFSSAGAGIGAEFQINLLTLDNQRYPSVGMDTTGGFVVAWQSNQFADGSGYAVAARQFSSAGVPISSEFVANERSADSQTRPAIAVKADGEFVVSWTSNTQDDQTTGGVFGRRFDRDAVPLTREFQVNTYTISAQDRPAVAAGGGRFVVTWESLGQDGEAFGIFAQRFVAPIPLDVDGNFLIEPLSDTLLALRYAFGFRGNTLINGAVGAGCTRCDAPSIEAYLADLAN